MAIVLLVHERAGHVRLSEASIERTVAAVRRVGDRLMFLPILNYADGYGFTYGGRVSTIGMLGMGERLSVPLTWGGTRRAALEARSHVQDAAAHARVESSVAIWQRENPHFEIDDRRVELKGRAERRFARVLRHGVAGVAQPVDFGGLDDRLWTLGADAALDTRADPNFRATPSCSAPDGPACTSAARPTESIATPPTRAATSASSARRSAPRASNTPPRPAHAARLRAAARSAAHPRCAASAPARSTAIARW